jgi:hypothetical protein
MSARRLRPMLPPVPVMMQTFSESRDDMTCLLISAYLFSPGGQTDEILSLVAHWTT